MSCRSIGWTLALVLALAVTAWADPPQINGIAPYGVQRGVPSEITVSGANLTGNPQVVASIPLAIEPSPMPNADAANWKLKLTVPAAVAVGVYTVRVKTDDGISNPFRFAVGQFPQVAEKEDNNTFETAQAVPGLVIVEGQSPGNDVDFFRFPGKKGERIVVDAQCSRIGSGVDPQIRLTTAARAFVASADDTPGLWTDARFTAVLPEDGDYVLELSDTRYQGGGRPIYRLQIGPALVAEEVYPLGGRRGETVGFEFRGGTLPDTRIAAATLAVPRAGDSFRLQVTNQAIGLAGPTDPALELELGGPIDVSELPEVRESAEADATAVRVTSPVVLNGRIDPAGDEDRFVLSVTPGQALRVQVNASDLGSALDGTLQVLGANNAVIATADDATIAPVAPKGQKKTAPGVVSPDPSLTFTPAAGVTEVTLALRDLEGRGGPGFPYRITVEPVTPTFEVVLNDPQVSIPKGGVASIPVNVARQGFGGPITLSVAEPPPGLNVREGTIPAGQAFGALSVAAAADAAFGPVTLKVVGTGQGPAGPIVVPATKLVVYSQQANLATNFETQVGLAAAPAQSGAVVLDTQSTPIEIVHALGGAIPVKLTRTSGADAALAVTAFPMPPGITFAQQNIPDKATEANLNLGVAPEAPLGVMTIALSAKGKFSNKDQTFGIPAVTLNIVRPADLELSAPNVEVKAGATAELKGKVVRKGAFKEPVVVKIDGLPAGLKADPITVAPDASEFVLKVIADPSAAAAMANTKTVMSFQINKKDYATPPTPLTVKVVK
jgi:hypothetical protein